MKTEKFKGTIESAYGKVLPTKLSFDGSFEAFTLPDTYKDTAVSLTFPDGADAITDTVSWGDLYSAVNAKRKANARQKSMNAVLEANGIEKPKMEDDPQLQLSTIIKALKASGRSEDEAIALAENTLGVKYQR